MPTGSQPSAAHCRGVRRIRPARQMLLREQAPDEHSPSCPCMAHSIRANRGKLWQFEDVIRSKIVVEIGAFYYRCPFVTLGDLECRWFEAGRQTGICCLRDVSLSLSTHVSSGSFCPNLPPVRPRAHMASLRSNRLQALPGAERYQTNP